MPSRRKKQSSPLATIAREFGGDPYGINQFRHDLAILKKKGLVSKKTDVRKQKVTRHYADLIRSLRDVIEGKAETVPVPKEEKAFFEGFGYKVRMERAIVPVEPGSKVEKSYSGGFPSVDITTPAKQGARSSTTHQRLVPAEHFEAYVKNVVYSEPEEKDGRLYGFRFMGGNSRTTYTSRESLLRHFLQYKGITDALRAGNVSQLDEFYRNFQVVTINGPDSETAFRQERKDQDAAKLDRRAAYRKQHRKYHKPSPLAQQVKTAYERNRRAELKKDSDPTALLEYREKAKARAKASRERKKE